MCAQSSTHSDQANNAWPLSSALALKTMKYILILIASIFLSACNTAEVTEYKKSFCSVDRKGFVFNAETRSNEKHTLSISNGSIYFKSTTAGKFTNNLEVSNSFIYTGSKEKGVFSYLSKSMKKPLSLGLVDYLCWSGLKTKYKGKVSFNEKITRS